MCSIEMYKKILIADDCEKEIEKLRDYLEECGIDVIYVSEPDKAFEIIENKSVDVIILDWFFAQTSSNEHSLEVLSALQYNKYYIPVFIYSNNINEEELYRQQLEDYPKVLITSMEKPNPSKPEVVKETIDKWFKSNPAVRLSKLWYSSISEAVGKTLGEMYDKMGKGVINLLNQSYSTETDTEKGCTNIIDLIMSILHNNILQEESLTNEVKEIIRKSSVAPKEEDYTFYESLRSFEMYSKVDNKQLIETGDIFEFNEDNLNFQKNCKDCLNKKKTKYFAVNITGECDYAKDKNLRYHKLVIGQELVEMCCNEKNIDSYIDSLSTYSQEGLHYLPFMKVLNEKNSGHVVLDFQNVISVNKKTYDDMLINKRIGRLRKVYCQHLLRRYSSYSSRIGVPEIPKSKKKALVSLVEKGISDINKANNNMEQQMNNKEIIAK